MRTRLLLAACLALGAAASPLSGQAPEVRGRIIDAGSQPVADQTVLLHRVVGASGANIAQARSDSAGRFTINVDSAGGADAVYFLAARWRDELYIGQAFREPLTATEHILQVGVPGTSATALLEGTSTQVPGAAPGMPLSPGGAPATASRWLLFLVPGVALLGVLVYVLLRQRPGMSARRRLLVRLAELDLERAGTTHADYPRQRAELIAQLRETPGP